MTEKVGGPMGYDPGDKMPAFPNNKHLNGGGVGVQIQRIGFQGDNRSRLEDGPPPGKLSSPFPYFGGKSRWIDLVFARIGKVGVWSEPCMGTAVMTLNNPEPAPREVICDLNAFICLEPGTPIWGADLHYRPVDTLAVGDKVMAFDEYSGGAHSGGRGCSRYRRWKVATVTATRRVVKRCFKLTMSDGTEFVCSAEHQWLTAGKRSGSLSWTWTKAADLVPVEGHGARGNGQSSYLLKPAPSPPQGHDFIDGWLGGMADGEGHMNVSKSMQLTIVQNPGRVQGLIAERLRAKGYEFSERPAHGTIATVLKGGGRDSSLRFLVEARPERLVDRFVERCGDVSIYGRKHNGVQLVEKQELGMREVVALETDSYTFIAAGYASHNCNFYRSLRADPDAVAYHADWPTNHHDLTARHRWLCWRRGRSCASAWWRTLTTSTRRSRAGGFGASHRGSGTGGAQLARFG